MHLVTLRMDRLYDVQKDPFSRNLTRTLISFDSNGKKYLSVSVEGSPKLAAGQTITVALQKPDNWQTVRGLLVHETGEMCVRSPLRYHWSMLLTAFVAVICFMELSFSYPHLLAPALIACGLIAGAFAYGGYRALQLSRLLQKVDRVSQPAGH